MAPEPPGGPSEGPKRLTRSHDSRLAGVAGGLAEYFDADPTLIRVLFVIALFLPGIGGGALIAYLIMWIVMPDPVGEPPPRVTSGGGTDITLILGIVILVIGVLLLLRTSWAWTAWFGWAAAGFIWPVILIAIGAWVIVRAQNRS